MTETRNPDINRWPARVEIEVKRCARCGGHHPTMEFRRFELSDPAFTHWALCPGTGEPILISMRAGQNVPKGEGTKFLVRFQGTEQRAKGMADPRYPKGRDITHPHEEGAKTCKAMLMTPAPGIGAWKVECTECRAKCAVVTKGLMDDPRSVAMVCQK